MKKIKFINLEEYKNNGFNFELNIKKGLIEEHTFNIIHDNKNIGFLKLNYIQNDFLEKYVYNDLSMINFVNDFIEYTGVDIENKKIELKLFNSFLKKYKINKEYDINKINDKLTEIFQNDLDSYLSKIDKFYISNIYIDKKYRKQGFGMFLFELGAYYAYKNNNRLYSDPEKRVTNFIWRKFEIEEKYDFLIDDYSLQSIIKKRKPTLKL